MSIEQKRRVHFCSKILRLVSSFCRTLPLTADLSVVVFDHQSDLRA